mmetsp:Transcript_49273/g.76956  ORF Transcript_49273/g.76956 Transcript_49273/m.76956 type:complete len:95 (-) Transcript_49273:120-404(-)
MQMRSMLIPSEGQSDATMLMKEVPASSPSALLGTGDPHLDIWQRAKMVRVQGTIGSTCRYIERRASSSSKKYPSLLGGTSRRMKPKEIALKTIP